MDDSRCEATVDLRDGNVLRCDRAAWHTGKHERWFMLCVWKWDDGGEAVIGQRTQIEREVIA